MERVKIASSYEEKWLQVERPSPLADNKIESLISDVLSGKLDKDITDTVYENFKLGRGAIVESVLCPFG